MASAMQAKVSQLQGGESRFFEESVHPEKVKSYLNRAKESDKLKGMKWLLAMMSKGRDVSVFFPDVVKNVIASSLEVKKMVYTYLVHYADANPTCRELALLSINSFQKDLVAPSQLIRALALRVMTSIRVRDIIQIQLLAVRKCAVDSSPYVRKCAANALPKIFALDPDHGADLQGILENLLSDGSTMVLGSAVAAFNEICPVDYRLLHAPYRKLCHLLADVDEWGQITMLGVLMRYARTQFLDPRLTEIPPCNVWSKVLSSPGNGSSIKLTHASNTCSNTRIMRRRVVRKAFYSDEEDESTEEEYEERAPYAAPIEPSNVGPQGGSSLLSKFDSDLQDNLDSDLSLLLNTSLPLLKSRNTGVVLGVCALHYYCSPLEPTRAEQIGKALVRILRSSREIQYVVLEAIKPMAVENPLMFRRFLHEFWVNANDPIFIFLAKLDILTALVCNENVEAVLRELQICIRSGDKKCACAAVQAVGKVAHSQPEVASSCLRGLMVLVRDSNQPDVVGETVIVVRRMLQCYSDLMEESDQVLLTLVRLLLNAVVVREEPPERPSTLTDGVAQGNVVWLIGRRLCSEVISNLAPEILRLLAKSLNECASPVKLQIMNFAAKLILHMYPVSLPVESLVSYVLEKCSFDPEPDVRDRARFLVALLGMCASAEGEEIDSAALVSLRSRAPSIVLHEIEMENCFDSKDLNGIIETKSKSCGCFVIGSLSATLGNRMAGYIDLPPWAKVHPDNTVRDPIMEDPAALQQNMGTEPYISEENGYDSEQDGTDYSSDTGSWVSSRTNSSRSASSSEYTSYTDSGSYSGSESSSGAHTSSDGCSSSDLHSSDEGQGESGSEVGDNDVQTSESEKLLISTGSAGLGSTGIENLCYDAQNMPQAFDISISNSNPIPTVPLNEMGNKVGRAIRLGDNNSSPYVHSTLENNHSFWSTLLSPNVADGLRVELSFARRRHKRPSGSVLDIIIRLKNMNKGPIRRIRLLPPWDGTPLTGWKEIQSLPPGVVKDVNLKIDCGTRGKAVRCELKTISGSYMITIEPPKGEILRPYQITADYFDETMEKIGPKATSEKLSLVSTEEEIPKRILLSANLFQLPIEQGRMTARFSGCSLTNPITHIVLVDVLLHSGARVLKVASDVPQIGSELAHVLKQAIETNGR